MSHHHPINLRRRAHRLRVHADRIERTPAMSLDSFATVDTWRGPRPEECLTLLRNAQQRIHEVAEELRRYAWLLESKAADLDAAMLAAAR